MKVPLLLISSIVVAVLASSCGDDSKCKSGDCSSDGAGGSGGQDPTGGTGGTGGTAGVGGTGGGEAGSGGAGGDGGTGGTGGKPDTSWTEVRPDTCTNEQSSRAINSNLWQEGFLIGVFPRLDPGYSSKATVVSYEENMTVINLKPEAGQSVKIKWAGVLGNYAVDEKVILEQTRDWTIIRKTNGSFVSAMFYRYGDKIPGETLEPLPMGGPSLRFAMQCNMQDDATCTTNVVSLLSGDGVDMQTFETGEIIPGDKWTISNRTVLQSANCPGAVRVRSLIWADGRP